jgi:hypothetical protein
MSKTNLLLVLGLVTLLAFVFVKEPHAIAQPDSSLPLDSPLPTPPPPSSPAAAFAVQFVAGREGIPVEKLQVAGEEEMIFPTLEQSFVYVTVFEIGSEPFRAFSLLVNPVTEQIEEDLNAVRARENSAYYERYGKFTLELYERLQTVDDDEPISISVWMTYSESEPTETDLYQTLASLYPEAKEALDEQGVPWAVKDPELAKQIEQKYDELLKANTSRRTQPVVDWLRKQGFAVEEFPGMPAIATSLPKPIILALAERNDVSQIYLSEVKATSASDIAIPTDRVPFVWLRGFTGSGIRIGIVENNNINTAADNCLDIVATRNSGFPHSTHKSIVAAIAACNDSSGVLKGVAPGAQILDAGHNNSQTDTVNALTWATNPASTTPATIINHSESYETSTAVEYLDRVYDYWVRQRKFTAVIAAGNTSGNVTTPGKAYNVVTVGNVDDKGNVADKGGSSWADDEMRASSAFINPTTGLEKPEVVAPGTNINTVAGQNSGTSFAAPQVAGLAALLMQRHATLKTWPSVVKAIIVTSAVHNIEGSKRLSNYDGAGSIDAALADQIAQTQGGASACNAPCWWNISTSSATPTVGGNLERYFRATQGDSAYANDSLLTNYDLYVIAPNGETKSNTVALSNFEIVDFTAPATGQYTISINRNASGDNNESGNFLGVAWVKLATYLPHVQNSTSNWTSTIYIRNDGAEPWNGKVSFFNQNGTFHSDASTTLQSNAVWSGATVPANWQGTAIVEGSDDISVVVRNDKTGLATLDNGIAAGGATDPAWGQVGTTLYVPVLYHNAFNYNSTMYLQNPNATATSVTLHLKGRSGHGDYTPSAISMNAQSMQALPVSSYTPSGWVGSLHLTANQPVAVRILEVKGTGESRSFNAAAVGRARIYAPAAYKNQWGFISGLVIQNLHGTNSTNTTLTYCLHTVTNPLSCPTQVVSTAALRATGVNLNDATAITNGWYGSVKFESSSSIPIAAVVTNANSNGGYDVSATGYGSKLAIFPYAAKQAGGRTTGYTVRNISTGTIQVFPHYYNANGTLAWRGDPTQTSDQPIVLLPAQVAGRHPDSHECQAPNTLCLPTGWQGTIVLEATGDMVAIMREDTTTTLAAYNGIAR